MTTLVPPVSFQNILVWVKPKADNSGDYDVVTEPADPKIVDQDTIINYQIVDTDGHSIVFRGMTVTPHNNDQLSHPTISVDGRLMTFSDLNTIKMTLSIDLKFKDKHGREFSHDPQIHNDPQS